ncbi:hypothetical protein [Blastococcus sp. VKM Ac-2987]|uniref:hypothetical protein n=1 Tax=Blastococcus sp. VKM Ac-2987 TaxID=3004141 RepID=UPI0022AB7BC3|nr:hypothetical protein [Blastococcus sp. VKM Ac-2987]MCZ2858483.1 hypothetical protein [Blastococcus sp. VKM Ac-2987]
MERSRGHDGLPPRITGRRADPPQVTEPVSVTVVLRGLEVVGYGRHAAPASAYGPADVHRLLPGAPLNSPAVPTDPEAAPVAVPDRGVPDAVVAAADGGTGARSSDELLTRATGFLARLRLLPRAA